MGAMCVLWRVLWPAGLLDSEDEIAKLHEMPYGDFLISEQREVKGQTVSVPVRMQWMVSMHACIRGIAHTRTLHPAPCIMGRAAAQHVPPGGGLAAQRAGSTA